MSLLNKTNPNDIFINVGKPINKKLSHILDMSARDDSIPIKKSLKRSHSESVILPEIPLAKSLKSETTLAESLEYESICKIRNKPKRNTEFTYNTVIIYSESPILRKKCITPHQDKLHQADNKTPPSVETHFRCGEIMKTRVSVLDRTWETDISYNRGGTNSKVLSNCITELPPNDYICCIEYFDDKKNDTTFFISETATSDAEDASACALRGAREEVGLEFDTKKCIQSKYSTDKISIFTIDIKLTNPIAPENKPPPHVTSVLHNRSRKKSILFIHGSYDDIKSKLEKIRYVAYSTDWNIRAISAMSRETALSIASIDI